MNGKATCVMYQSNAVSERGVYRLDPPMFHDEKLIDYVRVSAINVLGQCETFIFPSDADGHVLDWAELPGSFVGAMDIERALQGAGYDV